jgi:hypothetical protein
MTILVYLRMDEWQRSSQNRSGKVFAISGAFMSKVPLVGVASPTGDIKKRQDTEVLNLVDRHKQW